MAIFIAPLQQTSSNMQLSHTSSLRGALTSYIIQQVHPQPWRVWAATRARSSDSAERACSVRRFINTLINLLKVWTWWWWLWGTSWRVLQPGVDQPYSPRSLQQESRAVEDFGWCRLLGLVPLCTRLSLPQRLFSTFRFDSVPCSVPVRQQHTGVPFRGPIITRQIQDQ